LPEGGAVKHFIWKHKILSTVVLLAGAWTLWSLFASMRGELAARFDIARGHYEIEAYGLPVPWRPEYARLLNERHGVRVHTVALCIVSQSLRSYADSYNRVSVAAVNRKFGRDVFKECADDADRNWKRMQVARE
jgi:hypothetical protein